MNTHSSETVLRQLLEEIDLCLASATSDKLTADGIAEVRAGLAEYVQGEHQAVNARENSLVTQWLPRCLQLLSLDMPSFAERLSAAWPLLHWVTYEDYDEKEIGADFAAQHAYASLIGEGSHFEAPDYDLGLFLIAPDLLYRDHCHAAPELYLPLTGPHGWRFQPNSRLEIKQKLEPVWNKPGQPHLTKVGHQPFLSLYCWTRDNDKPALVVPANDWPELERLRLNEAQAEV
ncbi:MAG: dimethylsulfonioproprionate lyase family protein [Pseudomonadota bacterium]